jgi:hypothetical protein
MIPNVELTKNSSRKLRSGDSVPSCALNSARRAHSQSDGHGICLFYTHSRTLDAAASIQNVGATLQAQTAA